MKNNKTRTYVVSADISLLLKSWATQNGFVLPGSEFFIGIREKFSEYMNQIFPEFDLVSEEEIVEGLLAIVEEKGFGLPVISLDPAYSQGGMTLEITRLVDENGQDLGLGNRAGASSLEEQIKKIKASGIKEAVLVDDVIFSGALIESIVDMLAVAGIKVPLICAGIGIADGVKRIDGIKTKVECVRIYDEVIDEVCERDFYPGIPFSGRLLAGESNIGVPYILPFGSPEKWASIPSEFAGDFSKFCICQTMLLFKEIEKCSGRYVLCRDLERKVFGMPVEGERYVDTLHSII